MTPTPTYYTILSLPESLPPIHPNYQTTLKKAYHRTLLRCHPDKHPSGESVTDTANPHDAADIQKRIEIYSIDQINAAYKTLSSPQSRSAYDAELRSQDQNSNQQVGFRTGLDAIDLDDMIYHPGEIGDDETSSSTGRFTKSCRCGSDEGYVITEKEMDEIEEELANAEAGKAPLSAARSSIIGCLGCSLWLQVDWVVYDNEDEDIEA